MDIPFDCFSLQRMTMMSLLNIILVVQACIKVQFYLRVNESFGLLVQLVA